MTSTGWCKYLYSYYDFANSFFNILINYFLHKMKFCLILSLGVRGGSVVYAQEVIDKLSVDKTVIVSISSEVKKPKYDYCWITHRNPYEFFLYSLTLLPIYLIKTIYLLLKNRYSVIYLPYLHFWSIFFILIFKIFGKKTVITIHDGFGYNKNVANNSIWRSRKSMYAIQYLTLLCIRMADSLIFLSDYVKQELQEKFLFKARCFTIPHAPIVPQNLLQVPRKHKQKPNLLFFGKVLPSKGVENLIAAMTQINPNLYNKLSIVGKHYYDLDIAINNQKIVVIDRFIPETEVASFFNKADILILPYLQASQSGVATIGIAAGLPMVATKTGGLTEQLKPNEEGIFVESHPTSIAEGILTLIKNKYLYETISQNLISKQNKLSWQDISGSVANIIQTTADN